jgi:DNA-binding response OmpR family regulator
VERPANTAQLIGIASTSERTRVLIATADAVLCYALRPLLDAEGYAVSCVGADAAATLARVGSFRPHLILVDVAEPGGWDQDILGRLRAAPEHMLVGIVMLAAANDARKVTRQALALGADDVICKPCDRDLLVTRLVITLRAKAMLRQREEELLRCRAELAAALSSAEAPAHAPDTPDEPAG